MSRAKLKQIKQFEKQQKNAVREEKVLQKAEVMEKQQESKESVVKDLAEMASLNAQQQYDWARKFAGAFGIKFLGHPPHGANFSSTQSGEQVMQNVVDGMNEGPNKAQILNYVFQKTGIQLT